MQCQTIRPRLEDFLDGQTSDLERLAIEEHLRHCAPCSETAAAERDLRSRLGEYPAPSSPEGFADRVLATAGQRARRQRRQRFSALAAAAAALLVLTGSLLWPSPQPIETVHVARGHPDQVNLVFETHRAMEGVQVTLRIPDGMKVVGYEGQRRISWRTDLRAGRNQLTLPVVVDTPGALSARLQHEQGSKRFALRLKPGADTPDATDPQV
jgi:anti-sigma factor RsiW